jgi:hypothetical protein
VDTKAAVDGRCRTIETRRTVEEERA